MNPRIRRTILLDETDNEVGEVHPHSDGWQRNKLRGFRKNIRHNNMQTLEVFNPVPEETDS